MGSLTALVRTGVPRLPAYVYVGMWVIDCGKCPMTYLAQVGMPTAGCWRCGTTTEIVWPSAEMAAGIERLLMMRPDELNRNWNPGETLNDLMWENGQHGVFDNLNLELLGITPGQSILAVEEERIRVDRLPLTGNPTLSAMSA